MSENKYIGWDIGGAHLKMALVDTDGLVIQVEQHATPLWQGLESLLSTLENIKARLPKSEFFHAITTTGELSDLFEDRQRGVHTLLREFSNIFEDEQVLVYAGSPGLVSISEANSHFHQVASANWHATASYLARQNIEGVLVDIGSSTTDFISIKEGKVCNKGYTDQERMSHDELLYTGIARTPIMAIVNRVPIYGQWQSIAAEHFATMADVYRISGELGEGHDLMPAADGGEKQIGDSVRRLARMLGSDAKPEDANEGYHHLAKFIAEEQLQQISRALHRVISADPVNRPHLIGAGVGRFLATKLAQRNNYLYTDIGKMLNAEENQLEKAADCATAVSVAQLARLTR